MKKIAQGDITNCQLFAKNTGTIWLYFVSNKSSMKVSEYVWNKIGNLPEDYVFPPTLNFYY